MDYVDRGGFCPNDCKERTGFEEEHRQGVWPRLGSFDRSPDADREDYVWTDVVTYRCTICWKTVVFTEQWIVVPSEEPGSLPDVRVLHRQMICPSLSPRDLHESVPDAIRSLYREASTCERSGAMRAAGVMYRAAVEEMVKERGATGKDLHKKIEDMKNKGLESDLVDDLVTDLHEAREAGNGSIHDGIVYSADEIADIAQLIEEATVTLYVQPEQKRAMREARKARRAVAKASKK